MIFHRRIRSGVSIALMFGSFLSAHAATYYLSSVNGDDSRTATQAQSQATPWKTLDKLTTVTLAPGDRVLFARGEVFHGTIVVATSGVAGNPITFGAWGSGDRPVISGSVPVTGWTGPTATAYSATVNLPPNSTRIEQLFFDGAPMICARHPNQGYFATTTGTGKTGFSSAALAGSAINWTGASVHIKSIRWSLDYRTVTTFDAAAGTITLNTPANYDINQRWGFFLNNHRAALDTLGEWYFDSLARKVSAIMPDGGSPNGHTLEASVHAYGINLNNRQHVRIEYLNFHGQTDAGIYGMNAHSLYVDSCVVEWSDGLGINVGGNDISIVNAIVRGANVGGIALHGKSCLIDGCTVEKTGLLRRLNRRGLGGGWSTARGIIFAGGSNTVRGNILDSTGYIGIAFGGSDNIIEHNIIKNSCITIDDGAAIYTWSYDFAQPGAEGTVIRHNFVSDARGAPEGTAGGYGNAHGIYLDDRTHSIRVDSNTCVNNEDGIYLHNTRNHTVRGNVCYGNRNAQFRAKRDGIAGEHDMYDNIVSGNYFFAIGGSASCIENNLYHSNAKPLALYSNNYNGTGTVFDILVLRDAEPVWSWSRSFLDPLTSLTGGNLIRNGHFDSAQSWTAWPEELFTLSIDTEKKPGERTLKVIYTLDPQSGRSPLINSGSTFALTEGKTYRLQFSAASQSELSLYAVARQSSGSYAGLGLSRSAPLKSQWQDFTFYFTATASEARARIDFHNAGIPQTYWLDNVSLYQIADTVASAPLRSRIFTNPANTPKTVSLGVNRYRDLSGAFVTGQIILGPWSSRVLVLDSVGVAVSSKRGVAAPLTQAVTIKQTLRGEVLFNFTFADNAAVRFEVVDLRGALLLRQTIPASKGTVRTVSWSGRPHLRGQVLLARITNGSTTVVRPFVCVR